MLDAIIALDELSVSAIRRELFRKLDARGRRNEHFLSLYQHTTTTRESVNFNFSRLYTRLTHTLAASLLVRTRCLMYGRRKLFWASTCVLCYDMEKKAEEIELGEMCSHLLVSLLPLLAFIDTCINIKEQNKNTRKKIQQN